ncbi:MAG: serine/threonine protein kinase [Magnetococcus sp. DMHC-1]|nr:serine/threonine protein kinase [Magnetococcales bacterium]MBF0154348.1 serine/threonine protein kinase [Magnetococcales bacterium]
MNAMHLPIKYQLLEYQIERVLGQGGFGITYLAHDTNLDQKSAIKEFFPRFIVTRQDHARVVVNSIHPPQKNSKRGLEHFMDVLFPGSPHGDHPNQPQTDINKDSSDIKMFKTGMNRFLQEAKTLGKFNNLNIVRVKRFFKANGTAYMVMDYEEGETLDIFLKKQTKNILKKGLMNEENLFIFLRHVCDGLAHVHKAGVIHRDIKPGNILIRPNGVPVLIDFGAARQTMMAHGQKLTTMGTPAYSPPEQFAADGEQGPWSDIFSLASVLYLIVTGQRPINAQQRNCAIIENRPDPLLSASSLARGSYPARLLEAIDWGLKLDKTQRPQNLEQWLTKMRMVSNTPTVQHHEAQPESKSFPDKVRDELSKIRTCLLPSLLAMTFGVTLFASGERLLLHRPVNKTGTISPAPMSVPEEKSFIPDSSVTTQASNKPPIPNKSREQLPPTRQISTKDDDKIPTIQDNKNNPDTVPATPPQTATSPTIQSEDQYRLTIKTTPPKATIRILNIKPKYEPGMLLPSDSYHISVAKEGYQTRTEWIKIENSDLEITINLEQIVK